MKLSKRETLLLVVGFVVVSVAAYVFYFILPQLDKQQSIMTQLNTSKSTLQTANFKATAVEQLKKKVASLTSELDKESTNIPHGSNDTQILLYLRGLADQSKNDVNMMFADKPVLEGSFIRRTVTMECTTDYKKLSSLLDMLNKSELYNKVQIITAEYKVPAQEPGSDGENTATTQPTEPKPSAAAPTDTLNAHIEIYFYSFPLQQDEQVPAPPLPPAIKDRSTGLFPK